MDPRLTKGILALSAAISAAARVWFVDDETAAHVIDVVIAALVGLLIKTPGDLRLRPQIQQDAP
jgi:hypothetical protein